jgi:hypothetical protein
MCKFSRKSIFRLIFCVAFAAVIFVISFLLSGYYTASKPISYLPDIDKFDLDSFPPEINQIELKNPWFILVADKSGRLAVKTLAGEIIMSSLTFFSSYEGVIDNWGLKNLSVQLSNDSTISIIGKGPLDVLIKALFTIHNYVPKLDVQIRTQYNSDIIINREALVAKFNVPVTEVYLKNRKIDYGPFDSEYWLQRQGVRFGNGSRSSLIYNTPYVSSLQLNAKKNLLFINLEYYLDHPFVQIPYQKDGGGRWINLSSANFNANTERENNFSIYFGDMPQVTPRLMLVPYGYTAGYVFTEHADGGNLKTNRAAYFGDENISDINDAKGGFYGHKIPVTKSVFYVDSTRNLSEAFIRDDPEKPGFLDFLNQIYATGIYDICLHTPEGYNSKRISLNESIKFMKENFDTKTWIDHGMYSGNLNRESFVCDGLDPGSEYYAADLWKKYNTCYFWNPATELIENSMISPSKSLKEGKFYKAYVDFWKHYLSSKELKEMRFPAATKELLRRHQNKGELNSLRPDKGNAYPTPLFWQHPTRTKRFYSWTTNYEKDYGGLLGNKAEIKLLNEQKQLDMLCTNWGVFINHGYFVRNRKDHNIFSESNGKIVINPFFDKLLEFMAHMRDEGNLCITTIRDLLDYWIKIENISFEYMPDGGINVINLGDEPIKGLSLAVHAKGVLINGEIPSHKQVGEDTIVWFDIPANSNVRLHAEL